MSDDSRIVRDLLDSNRHLTDQLVELARLVIGAPSVASRPESTYEAGEKETGPDDPFTMPPPLDWEDIPELPAGEVDPDDENVVRSLEVARRGLTVVPEEELPIYMSEEEEDMRHSVALSLRPRSDLDDLLSRYALPGQRGEEVIEFSPDQS